MPLIRPNHLEQLAEQTAGRDQLGELIRKLIYCWVPKRVLGISFLAGDVNNFPGWDGWLRLAPTGTVAMELEHRSVWQISVERNAINKVRQDFKKSLKAPLHEDWTRATTTYVALTPRKLSDARKLETELRRTKGNTWYDVRVIDAIDLEQWIDKCYPVEAWAGEHFGIGAGRFGESPARRWTGWAEATAPAISADLLLAGRDINVVKDGLRFQHNRTFAVQSDSPEESVALVYAVINTLPQESRDRLIANALVISKEERADEYALQPIKEEMESLTILVPPAVSYANALARAGHRVVMAFGRNDPNAQSVVVRRALRSDFEKALSSSMGVAAPDATAQARACGCSVSVWRVWNLLRTAGAGGQKPTWARDDAVASRLVPAALLRSWDEQCEGDKSIVAELCGQEYPDYRDALQPYGTCDDPLFDRVGSVFNIVAPAVAFTLLERLVTPSHVAALERSVKRVFGEIEKDVAAVWDAPPDDKLQISEKPRYSTWLRDGLAETLLGIAFLTQGQSSGAFAHVGGGQQFVDRIVRALPGLGSDPRMLAALRDQLPYLAEAAPLPFVEALESLLQGDSSRLEPLFRDRGFFGPTFHAGLLWALETLAWSVDYLPRVALILGGLDQIDPGGNIGNRPRNSLREIFIAWHQGTSATIEDRIATIQLLHRKYPDTAWWLLLKLLPQPHDTATPTQEPTWRDFGRSETPALTKRLVVEGYLKYTDFAFDVARGQLRRQIALVESYPQFPPEYRKRLVEMLVTSSNEQLDDDLRAQAWKALHKIVTHHRAFRDALWAMEEQDLEVLAELASRYLPHDPVGLHKWILDDQWPETGHKADDFEGKQRDIDKRRRDAVQDILNQLGLEGIHRAIREFTHPNILAFVLAEVIDDDTLLKALDAWAKDSSRNHLLAISAASGARLRISGTTWTNLLINHIRSTNWSVEATARTFMNYPAEIETFQLVQSLGSEVENYYWQHGWLYIHKSDVATKRFFAESYIRHGRAADTLDAVGGAFKDFGVDLVLRIIDETIKQLNRGHLPTDRSTFGYHLEEALKWLRAQPDVTPVDIARLEYPLLPLLTGRGRGEEEELVLHRLLSQDADFFVQVLCDLYRPASGPSERTKDKSSESKGLAAWRLLESWRLVPGLREDGSIDKDIFLAWVGSARALAAEKDRTDIADQHIGKLFFHAPRDRHDKSWPPLAVLELIENLNTPHIGRGFALECINSRGVTSRAPLDGGKLERAEEQKWRERAKGLGSHWPRVRALFEAIAEDWRSQAKWHDEDAEKMRIRWS